MVRSDFHNLDEESFFDRVKAEVSEKMPNLSQTLNMAVIGKVSAGKSSLINALLKLSRKEAHDLKINVGAVSGVTKQLNILKLDEKVCLIDSPGLDDVIKENSEVTKKFLEHIDVGIFVVTGSSDASQKKSLDDLRKHCDEIFVVLNKIDQWDDLDPSALDEIAEQWKRDLAISKIYRTCAKGYDPKSVAPNMDIRGVVALRSDVEKFLEKKGKDLLLARHMAEKQSYAIKIIATALVAVVVAAFLPGSAASITSAQVVAIVCLYYLYTGEILSSNAALAVLPTVLSQNVGTSLFLLVKSFVPPTGVLDVAAAGVAVVITIALLSAVNYVLSIGARLDEEELLRSKYRTYQAKAATTLNELALTSVKDLPSWVEIVTKFLK